MSSHRLFMQIFNMIVSLFFPCCHQLQLWDTAGEERFRQGGLTNSYFRGAHGALIVFSLTSVQSFENVKKLWIDEFYRRRYNLTVFSELNILLSNTCIEQLIRSWVL